MFWYQIFWFNRKYIFPLVDPQFFILHIKGNNTLERSNKIQFPYEILDSSILYPMQTIEILDSQFWSYERFINSNEGFTLNKKLDNMSVYSIKYLLICNLIQFKQPFGGFVWSWFVLEDEDDDDDGLAVEGMLKFNGEIRTIV